MQKEKNNTITKKEKTTFQTRGEWKPTTDIRSDAAMVYSASDGPGMTFEQRAQSWRDHGYNTQFLTGMAWGSYQDYFLGKWDGMPHLDEAQVQQNGDTIWHGKNTPYFVPTMNYLKYFKEKKLKRVIDKGIDAIYLEDPEYWSRAGYSAAFKKEEPNDYTGVARERTFETAFLEYGCMRSMTMPTNRKLYFESDPVEDTRRDWSDYKKNYQATFTAELFFPFHGRTAFG